MVEISKFKDAAFWACFWVAGEGGWPERVAKTLFGKPKTQLRTCKDTGALLQNIAWE